MIFKFINWANNNQGFVAILLFLFSTAVGISGFFIRRFILRDRFGKSLIQKQKGGDNSTNIQAGRDINVPK
ncbi:MAG: hypothetical protein A2908_03455 [Candidatus Staskawiczbacteria bacterium RIFCSPLOWO2_01_FULL_38_12b]|uniref:Uncharacterized protein n=1 Tax=Candidatus Staskawiczbacteria bacterium RIFCSPLOWO2_01_FULL_38_12b TaxID=1802214 RepID=A0A1G2IH85_9BACT|nr:MAG: hypothetical protein A2908_03455 [Candidatus Staskawiczbacteria bacterium RIFCSPLOWO2_01_FULL_38_12b]